MTDMFLQYLNLVIQATVNVLHTLNAFLTQSQLAKVLGVARDYGNI